MAGVPGGEPDRVHQQTRVAIVEQRTDLAQVQAPGAEFAAHWPGHRKHRTVGIAPEIKPVTGGGLRTVDKHQPRLVVFQGEGRSAVHDQHPGLAPGQLERDRVLSRCGIAVNGGAGQRWPHEVSSSIRVRNGASIWAVSPTSTVVSAAGAR